MEKWLSLDSNQGMMSHEYIVEPMSKETLKTCTHIYILTNTKTEKQRNAVTNSSLKCTNLEKLSNNVSGMAFITQIT